MRGPAIPFLIVAALAAGRVPAELPATVPALHDRLPKDPVLVLVVQSAELTGRLQALARWQAGEPASPAAAGTLSPAVGALERRLGVSLERDVLDHIGPEIALTLDLPPLDALAATLHLQSFEGLPTALGRSGLIATVRDARQLDRNLRKLLEALSAVPIESGAVVTAHVPLAPGAAAGVAEAPAGRETIAIHYAIRDGRIAVGFSPEWVARCLEDRASEERLAAGADYRKVFSHLDARPQSLAYVNLPKLRALIEESEIARTLLQNNEGIRRFLQPLLDPAVMSVGLGSTSILVDGGARTTHFGPPWMSGVAASGGLLAAMAVPTLLVANDRNKARETLGNLQSIARACDGFSSDVRTYPGPTAGWVPVASVAAFLEPMYIGSLPRVDAWNNPILYWSNGTTYRVLSTGTDGRMDQDWSGQIEPAISETQAGDIVMADGHVLVLPRDLSD